MARSEDTSTSPPSMPTPLTASTPTRAAARRRGSDDRRSTRRGRSAIALRMAWCSPAAARQALDLVPHVGAADHRATLRARALEELDERHALEGSGAVQRLVEHEDRGV